MFGDCRCTARVCSSCSRCGTRFVSAGSKHSLRRFLVPTNFTQQPAMFQGPLGITNAECFISFEAMMRRAGWVARRSGPTALVGTVSSLRIPVRASNVTLAPCVSRWDWGTNCRSTRVVVQKFAPGQFLVASEHVH
jgi:hypothetical protein